MAAVMNIEWCPRLLPVLSPSSSRPGPGAYITFPPSSLLASVRTLLASCCIAPPYSHPVNPLHPSLWPTCTGPRWRGITSLGLGAWLLPVNGCASTTSTANSSAARLPCCVLIQVSLQGPKMCLHESAAHKPHPPVAAACAYPLQVAPLLLTTAARRDPPLLPCAECKAQTSWRTPGDTRPLANFIPRRVRIV